jgi:hypothetical protein
MARRLAGGARQTFDRREMRADDTRALSVTSDDAPTVPQLAPLPGAPE